MCSFLLMTYSTTQQVLPTMNLENTTMPINQTVASGLMGIDILYASRIAAYCIVLLVFLHIFLATFVAKFFCFAETFIGFGFLLHRGECNAFDDERVGVVGGEREA